MDGADDPRQRLSEDQARLGAIVRELARRSSPGVMERRALAAAGRAAARAARSGWGLAAVALLAAAVVGAALRRRSRRRAEALPARLYHALAP